MKLDVVKRDGNLHVDVRGALDESAEAALTTLAPKLAKHHAVISLEGVDRINSIGFRAWIEFLKSLDAAGTFELIACPYEFVEYCNLLPTTAFAERIASLQVPYACKSCGHRDQPVRRTEALDPSAKLAPLICPTCNGTMSALIDPEQYLEFLDR